MNAIAQVLAKKALKDVAAKNIQINSQNPFEEDVPVHDKNGRPTGKTTKRKRGLPSGLSQNDTLVLKRVRSRAYHLDMSLFNCCGIRFGWSSVIGIIPVIGDFLDAVMAWMLMRKADKIDGGLPPALRARMLFNIVLDFCLGLVPLLGDLADAVFRANTRNAWLLEAYLVKKAEAEAEGDLPPPSSQGEALLRQKGSAKTESNTAGGFFGLGRRKNADEEMDVGTASNRTGGRGTAGNPTTMWAK
ncbi:hypothetical protein P8C59_003898 [Phyllachora maydis]|uniref:Uncharacterized protein n=1 Tax=Phyllachora maydis TaxID=1825666 RepID=A0AAD9I2W0_9PEZI|nr:hypothetical protein P8C59_003898 [Phyllachora maydis]